VFLGPGHPSDSFLIKPSLLGTGSLDLIAFFSVFTMLFYICFCCKNRTVFYSKNPNCWNRQVLLIKRKHLEKHQARVSSNATSRDSESICYQLKVVYWAAWNELLDAIHVLPVWLLLTVFHVRLSNSLIDLRVGVTVVLCLVQLPLKSVANLLNWLQKFGQCLCTPQNSYPSQRHPAAGFSNSYLC